MTQIAITDEVASNLASAADARGCTQEELASALIEDGLRWQEEIELTPEQQARLLESYAQASRGDLIDGEVLMAELRGALNHIAAK